MKIPMAKPAHTISQTGKRSFPDTRASIQNTGDIMPIRQDDFDRDVWCLLGLPVDIADIDRAVAEVEQAVRDRRRLSFVTPNVNWFVRAMRDPKARSEILDADLSLIDGAPLAMLAKFLGVPVPARVAGSDLFEALRRRPGYAGRKIRVYLFGGRDGAAEAAAAALNRENGGLQAVGWHNPGFGDLDSMSAQPIIDKVNNAEPDFLVVALGAAKGQAWIDRNQAALNAPVLAHLGAVVDFTAGRVDRAPKFIQQCGLEWLWRIKEEPSLWRRYFDDGIALAKIIATRFFPQMQSAAPITSSVRAHVEVEQMQTMTVIHLSGDVRRATLRPVRNAFRQAAARQNDVRINFSSVASFDRAFLGLLLMLEKQLARNGRIIYVDGVCPAQQRMLRANEMRYSQIPADAQQMSGLRTTQRAAV